VSVTVLIRFPADDTCTTGVFGTKMTAVSFSFQRYPTLPPNHCHSPSHSHFWQSQPQPRIPIVSATLSTHFPPIHICNPRCVWYQNDRLFFLFPMVYNTATKPLPLSQPQPLLAATATATHPHCVRDIINHIPANPHCHPAYLAPK
jgi:hypothetical protein